jgi:hypothetical protein
MSARNNMLIAAKSPPTEVTLLYRNLGMTHVFIAENFRGFHVGGTTLRDALDTAIHALGMHVSSLYSLPKPVEYRLDGTLDEFEDRLQDADAPLNFTVTARITATGAHAH